MHYRYLLTTAVALLASLLFLQAGTELPWLTCWQLISGQINPDSFETTAFFYARLPRLTVAILVGAALGLTGSLLQQLTRNPLLSPSTLGVSSGAWLALVIINIWFPALSADYSPLVAMTGATAAVVLVIAITGIRNLSGLPVVLSGMAVNILLGAITSALVLFHNHQAKALFIWGAGDLSQYGWENMLWLAPKLLPALLVLFIAPKILLLLRLGHTGARTRGLAVAPAFLLLCATALWLVATSISSVGVIGFIGLLAPNIARALGARLPGDELLYSTLLGATLLLVTDTGVIWLNQISVELVPSGLATALIGAPAIIWLSHRRQQAEDTTSLQLPRGLKQLRHSSLLLLCSVLLCCLGANLLLTQTDNGWLVQLPDAFSWSLRWPRLLGAVSAGAAMAVSGAILQRLIHNPLASPDLMGMSAGAVLALIIAYLFSDKLVTGFGPLVALAGSMLVLIVLLLINIKNRLAPAPLILTGIALAAMIEAIVQFVTLKGTDDIYSILGWLSGSTYRIDASKAVLLFGGSLLVILLTLLCHRGITLLSINRAIASGRGLASLSVFTGLLIASALLSALVAALLGPLAFVGLLAPHMASMLGARRVVEQFLLAALAGAALVTLADWLGQNLLYPTQISAGILASVIGAIYFLGLQLFNARRT